MKKNISIAFAAMLVGLAISCQKEELVSDKTDAVQYTLNINVNDQAGFDNDATTKGGSSESRKTAWESGDRIFLFFKPFDGDNLLKEYATLKYNGSSWVEEKSLTTSNLKEGLLSAVYVYNLGSDVTPIYSENDDKWTIETGNTFYNCHTIFYTVSGNVISASLNLEAPADFVQFYVANATGVLTCDQVKGWKDIAIGSDMAFSNVTCTGYMDGFDNSGDKNVKEYYGRIVDGGTSLKDVECAFSVVKNGKVHEHTATPSSDAKSFKMSTSATGEQAWTEAKGKLPGLFSVEAGMLIRFSKGNLYYDGSKFNFEANQYDTTPASNDSWSTDHISHFYWCKSAGESIRQIYIDSDANDVFFTNETETTAKTSFSVDVDGKEQTGWRTLSTAEWQYLFSYDGTEGGSEPNGTNYDNVTRRGKYKYGVTICGKANCVVLLPDNWEWDETADEHNVGIGWQTEGYPETQTSNEVTWEVMENAGAVCLPAAGYRSDSFVIDVSSKGYYWSSTAGGSRNAYHVCFDSGSVTPGSLGEHYFGFSARLITEYQSAPSAE